MRLAQNDPGVTSNIVRYTASNDGLEFLFACFLTILKIIKELTQLFRDWIVEISRSNNALPLPFDVRQPEEGLWLIQFVLFISE